VQVQLAMVSELVEHRMAEAPPDVVLRPKLPDDITVLTGFSRGDEAIRVGVEAAEASLDRIRTACGVSGEEALS
jgi:predicted acylesterase/phospholipase RssA